MALKINKLEDRVDVEIHGEMNIYKVPEFKLEIFRELEEFSGNLVTLNMENVHYVDSSGIGFLIQLQRRLQNQKIKMEMNNLKKDVLSTFKISALDKHFVIK